MEGNFPPFLSHVQFIHAAFESKSPAKPESL